MAFIALVENGSWAPASARQMRSLLGELKEIEILEPVITVKSALKKENLDELLQLKNSILSSLEKL